MRFTIHTYGCQMNVRESEAARALMEASGHSWTEQESEADLILVNSCSVREKAEDKALGKLGLLCAQKRQRRLFVGVAGCMAQRLAEGLFERIPSLDFVIGTRCSASLPGVAARLLSGEKRVIELGAGLDAPQTPSAHTRTPTHHAFVTILMGCERRCSYCIVPETRGREYSRPPAEILAECRALVDQGVKEITLLGQSVMNYGRASNPYQPPAPDPFNQLLSEVASIEGLRRVRFTSGHPSGVTPGLIETIRRHPNICGHLHLPVQSGSDRILKAMRRGYTRARYLEACAALKSARHGFTLTTDVIVGYPGETEEDFQETRTLMEEVGFANAFIFKYSPRPGTPAALLPDDVTPEEKARRNQILLSDQDLRGARQNAALIGHTLQVLADGPSLRNPSRWSGRTPGNRIVIFDPKPGIAPGDLLQTTITAAAPQTLYATLQ
ncbi:MAG: tRNA (N6-isopentenyl adenosine(37)-C2)-methylthiotransferase MiaB [Kiritimatiellia bacterium]